MSTKIEWTDEYTKNKDRRIVRSDGYALVVIPSYPLCKPKGYVFEHRIVIAIHLGRTLESHEVVHHINGNRSDNRLINLELMENGQHVSFHQKEAPQELVQSRIRNLRESALKRKIPRIIKACECGCGEMIETPDSRGRNKRFTKGHNQKGRNWKWQKVK